MKKEIWHNFLIKSGNLFFRYRNYLFPSFIIILFTLSRPQLFFHSYLLDKFAVAGGIVIALCGAAFRLLVISFAYIKRGGKDGRVWAESLVCEGFYAHVRNPMYTANFLIASGIGIIYGSLYVYLVIIPLFAFIYLSIVTTEENYLKAHFGGEYQKYCRRVNRFIPNFKGLKHSLANFHYDWRKALRKDYGTFFGVLFGCYFTLLWKGHYFYKFPTNSLEAVFAATIFILLASGYIIIRRLKKTGRLR